jgi:hypothetical protein
MSTNKPSRGTKAGRVPCRRNPVARSSLLRKGGPHERSAGGKRHRTRLSVHEAIEEWLETEEAQEGREGETGSCGSPFCVCRGSATFEAAAVRCLNFQ